MVEANLRAAAIGSVDSNPTARQLARDEIRLVLDGLPAHEILSIAVELAGRPGDLASELLGRWGRTYLASRGVERVEELQPSRPVPSPDSPSTAARTRSRPPTPTSG